MNVFDAEIKVLDTEIFPQHTIADLNSGTTLREASMVREVSMVTVERSLYGDRKIHTHIHTHTHTHEENITKSTNRKNNIGIMLNDWLRLTVKQF